jgi:hypothetical protein
MSFPAAAGGRHFATRFHNLQIAEDDDNCSNSNSNISSSSTNSDRNSSSNSSVSDDVSQWSEGQAGVSSDDASSGHDDDDVSALLLVLLRALLQLLLFTAATTVSGSVLVRLLLLLHVSVTQCSTAMLAPLSAINHQHWYYYQCSATYLVLAVLLN